MPWIGYIAKDTDHQSRRWAQRPVHKMESVSHSYWATNVALFLWVIVSQRSTQVELSVCFW